MNLIERAGNQLGLKSAKSSIEKAVDRLATTDRGAVSAATAPGPSKSPLTGRRETRQQITLDFDRLRAMGLALPQDQSPLAEEFRLIKRPLVNTALSTEARSPMENRNLIMVTSAGPNEGKTFVAVNLAFSIASEHDMHVLLIDADLTRPTVPSVLGFEAGPGLIDAVSDDSIDLADVMIRTNIENLSILSSGVFRSGSSELLASSRMARFVDDIARRYPDRIIIFDSPPVLARSEPMVLAKHVGQIVFVVEAERTSRAAVDEALRMIGQDRIAGIVLNKAPAMAVQDRFGQHYGYYGR
jgi:protein-tyrosine kinase